MVHISVIVPAKNEAGGVAKIVRTVAKHGDEVIVIDGHSTDGTGELAERAGAKVVIDGVHGKGSALRMGIEEARGEVLVFIDADGSHEPDDIPRLVQPILDGRADLVVASRTLGGSDEFNKTVDGFLRRVGSDVIALAINWRWGVQLTDVENGFRAIRADVVRQLNLTANDFDIGQEMVMKCLKKGFRIMEVPSHEYVRAWGRSKLSTWKGWKFVWGLLREMYTRNEPRDGRAG
jgi:glycosyltransferase involved in cell wall biosynthesis